MAPQLQTDARIIVALDVPTAEAALALVDQLDRRYCRLKVGKELFVSAGPDLVRQLVAAGWDLFLDLKFHDIPNTVAAACRVAADLGVWMTNVHALGGPRMLQAAREAIDQSGHRLQLIAVTILTSMGGDELAAIGLPPDPLAAVERLARLSAASGLDGVVCSPQEAAPLRAALGSAPLLVTPGIRPAWAAKGDQTRITTPAQALADGASYLVIGRPITAAADPAAALARIVDELNTPMESP